jgi:hypothetical protein
VTFIYNGHLDHGGQYVIKKLRSTFLIDSITKFKIVL